MTFRFLNSAITLSWVRYLILKPKMIRFYRPWAESLKEGRLSLRDNLPWMVFEAIDWLEGYLKPQMRVFEWGAGGSTLFFAKRARLVITVEHNPHWHSVISRHLNNQNVHLILCEPDKNKTLLKDYMSSGERYRGQSFQSYAKVIDFYPDNMFDLVVVDGRARSACMRHAVGKIRPGGYLLLDNSEREIYESGKQFMSNWPSHVFCGPGPYIKSLWATTIWQKPKSYFPCQE